jgi:hypothetical protein
LIHFYLAPIKGTYPQNAYLDKDYPDSPSFYGRILSDIKSIFHAESSKIRFAFKPMGIRALGTLNLVGQQGKGNRLPAKVAFPGEYGVSIKLPVFLRFQAAGY